MKRFIKKSCLVGLMVLVTPLLHGIAYETECENLYVNNKTNYDLLLRFRNAQHGEQQQFPVKAKEHLSVRISANVMISLSDIQVSIDNSALRKKQHHHAKKRKNKEPLKQASKEIDYDRNTQIVGLEITMNPDLDLKWKRDEDYLVPLPGTEGAA